MTPSTAWREQIEAGEDERFAAYAEQLSAVQRRTSERQGHGRALHRKQVLALRGRLEGQLGWRCSVPDYLERVGLE